ncbi:hypothetical protein BBI17_009837, partial [Phytophthora kernoviae]
MPNIDKVFVAREQYTADGFNGFVYRVFFHGNGVYGDVNQLTYTYNQCTVFQTQVNNILTAVSAPDTRVVISMTDPGGFNVGNKFVKAATATAAQLAEDLDQLPVFGDVLVSQSLVDEQGGYIWTVVFKDSEGDLPQFICAVDSFATGTGCETDTLTDGNALSGSFIIEASASIPFNADAATMKAALEAMSWVGTVQVQQSAPSPQYGYTWTITFLDYRGDMPTLLVTSSLVGTGSQITVREVRKGNALGGTFMLAYLKSVTAPIEWDAHATAADSNSDGSSLQEKLEALDVVGQVNVQRSANPDQEGGYVWLVTFLDNVLNSGDLPLLQGNASTLSGEATVVDVQAGITNFRKEVVVFSCQATVGNVGFTYGGVTKEITFNAALSDVEALLSVVLFGVEAESISVTTNSAQTLLCVAANAKDIKIVFNRVYGDIQLGVAQGTTITSDATITPNTAASIDGVYYDNPALVMSGTFQVGYQGQYTRPLNAKSTADQLRYALEDLGAIRTVGATRDQSYRALPGKIDVTEGEIFVTCSSGETCKFDSASYGLPGYTIRIDGDWYTIRTDLTSPGLDNTRLYLGDLNGREIGYLRSTDTYVTVYEWTK